MDLFQYVQKGQKADFSEKDYEAFKTEKMSVEELRDLKMMGEMELRKLMMFCGIMVHDEMPVIAMTEDEMRTAYLAWRYIKVKEYYAELKPKAERGLKWVDRIRKVIQVAAD